MGYVNQPPDLYALFKDLNQRLLKLETAVRFTAPNVATVPTYPRVGDIIYNNTNDYIEYWNGTNWVVFGDNNLGTPIVSWTPTWASANNNLVYTGTPVTGHYLRIGKMITYTINVDCSTVTNFGTGQYSLTLPTGLAPGYDFQHIGGLHKASNHYTLLADFNAASTSVVLYHPTSNGAQDIFSYNKPTTLTTASYFYISGSYFLP